MITDIEAEDIALAIVRELALDEIDAIANTGLFEGLVPRIRELTSHYPELRASSVEVDVMRICIERAGGLDYWRLVCLCHPISEACGDEAAVIAATRLWNVIDSMPNPEEPWRHMAELLPDMFTDPRNVNSLRFTYTDR